MGFHKRPFAHQNADLNHYALADDWNLLSNNKANAKTLAQCRSQAAETHKPQDCPITVPVRK